MKALRNLSSSDQEAVRWLALGLERHCWNTNQATRTAARLVTAGWFGADDRVLAVEGLRGVTLVGEDDHKLVLTTSVVFTLKGARFDHPIAVSSVAEVFSEGYRIVVRTQDGETVVLTTSTLGPVGTDDHEARDRAERLAKAIDALRRGPSAS